MASSIRFDTQVRAAQPELLSLKWIHKFQNSSGQTHSPNKSVIIIAPSDDDLEVQPTDAEAEVEELFEEFLASNEPNNILIAEEMQSLDDAEEDENIDTSALVYNTKDLSLNWESPVRNSCQDVMISLSPFF